MNSTNFKKVLSVVLATLMLVSAVPSQLFAATASNPWEGGTVNSNVFLNALSYLGYDTTRFTIHGEYGKDVAEKYRTDIGYNTAGANGTETTSAGKPNVSTFESKGLCCASYVSYCIFNYLPNVYGIDTSDWAKPSNYRSATSWRTAMEKWVSGGYATKVTINGSTNPSASTHKNLDKLDDVPVGSIITFRDSAGAYHHVSIYAGYKNGRHFQNHVGNSRGPEIQTIEYFLKSSDEYYTVDAAYIPIVPVATGYVGVQKVDDAGKAVSGAKIGMYSDSACTNLITTLTTNSEGKAVYEEALEAGTTVYFKETTAPTGYDKSTQVVSATVVADKTTYASTKIVDNRQGKITLTKKCETGTVMEGVTFTIYSDADCTKSVGTMTTNANGVATSGYLKAGTYYVVETNLGDYSSTHIANGTVFTATVTKGGTYDIGTVVDKLRTKGVYVQKTSEDGIVLGHTFHLYGTSNSGVEVDMTATTDGTGEAFFANVPLGTYTLEEVNVADRYIAPAPQSVTVTKRGNAVVRFFYNALKTGILEVTKTSESGEIEGFEFELSGTTLDGSTYTATGVTDENGKLVFKDIPFSEIGAYTLTEINAVGYEPLVVEDLDFRENYAYVELTVNNVLSKGSLKVIKTSEDGNVSGVKFQLSGSPAASNGKGHLLKSATTDENGVATFTNIPVGTYILKEMNLGSSYIQPASKTVTVEANKTTTVKFHNVLRKICFEVQKADSETTTPQGDATLEGAVFQLYNSKNQVVGTYTTDETGYFITDLVPCNDAYIIREVSAPTGYVLNSKPININATSSEYNKDYNYVSIDFPEDVIKGQIDITKYAVKNGVQTPEAGAEFTITLKSTGEVVETLTIDENGSATSSSLPYGTYLVHQTKGWEGYKDVEDFEVFISENGKTYSYILNDDVFTAYVKVTKTDAETGKPIAYSGAGFQIYDEDGNLVTAKNANNEVVDVFYTDVNGILITPVELAYGDYTLVEVIAPYGYILDSTPVPFSIKNSTMVVEDGLTVVKVYKEDYSQKGTISVYKQGEVFHNVSESDGRYTPEYKAMGLAGAVYEIYAAEDITTLDGTVRVTKGTLVDTITTDSTGYARSKALYLGKYEVVEISAPEGYVKDTTPKQVVVAYGDQTETLVSTGISFTNDRQKADISFTKVLELNDAFDIGNNGEFANIKFGLYANQIITAANGTVIPKDGLIEVAYANPDGTVKFYSDIPFGQYYVKEIATDEHYVLNGTKYLVTFSYAGQDTNVVSLTVNDGVIFNSLKQGSIEGLKLDENGEPVANAVIGLFLTKDATTPIATVKSDSSGVFRFDVPVGTWFVKEISAPEGFMLNETVFTVTIANNGENKQLTIVNEHIKGSLELTKADAEYTDELLSGAVFYVYKDTDNNGVYNAGDEKVGEFAETSLGVYSTDLLLYGRYFIKEITAPNGFLVDNNTYEVFIRENGKVYTISNDDSGLFLNTAKKGNLDIVKTAEDGRVEGKDFKVFGTDVTGHYYENTFTTDSNGIIHITGLREGTYTVEEINLANGYVQPEAQTVTVKNGTTTEITFYNALQKGDVKVNKTSEDNVVFGIEFKLYGTSLVGNYIEMTATTDTNGVAMFKDIPIGNYKVEEINVPDRYLTPASQSVVVEFNKTSALNFENVLKKGNITLTKVDVDYPDNKLSDATFGVYEDVNKNGILDDSDILYANLVETSKGVYELKNIPYGDYLVKELQAPTGFLVDNNVYKVSIRVDGMTYTVSNDTSGCFINNPMLGNLDIVKTSEDGVLEGFQFRVTGTSITGHKYDKTFVTDKNGEIHIENLRIGTYTVTELNVAERYIVPAVATVSIETNKTAKVEIHNALKRGNVVVFKTSEDNILAGHKFHLYGMSLAGIPIDEYAVSDENGVVRFDNILISNLNGYVIEEVEVADQYIAPDAQKVDVKYNSTSQVEFFNEYKRGTITLTKVDRDYRDELLSNATFTIYRDSDNNGIYNIGDEKVGTLTETSTGVYKSELLIYGRYFVKETKAPLGFVADTTPYEVFIDTNGKVYTVSNDGSGLFVNAPRLGDLNIVKEAEDNRVIGREFKVTGTSITGHYFEGTFKTDADGEIYIPELREGYYTIEEINTPDGYIQPETVEVYVGHGNVLIVEVYNALERGDVVVTKDAEDGIIENVEFKLYGTSTVGDYFETYAKTDKNGVAMFKDIPVGNYTVEEVNVPARYLPVSSQNVTVEYNGTATLKFENMLKKGNMTLTKIDVDYPENKLTNAVFGVYLDVNENGILDSKDAFYANLIETSEGIYELKDIPYGHYLVKELVAPIGFLVDDNVYEVFIEIDGMTYTVSNDTSGCFINNPALGSIDIIKTSEDGIVEGFEFRVTGKTITGQSYDEIFVTDANGRIHIENLRIGTYTVTELNVADRYIAPDDVTVSVETGKITEVNVHNALKRGNLVVHKTAEDDILAGHKFHLYGMSLAGIFVDEYAVTDENGIAVFENILISDLVGYVIEEVETADRYLVPEAQIVYIEYELTSEVEFYNELKHGNITLTKVDNDIRDKLLSGAEFEVYFDVNDNGIFEPEIDIFVGVMNETEIGIYRIDDVRYGGYFIHEKTAPTHYIADGGYYYVAVLTDGETVVVENTEGTGLFVNGIKLGNILIIKNSEDGKKEGFSFLVTGNGISIIVTTDAEGKALVENLRVDSEYVIEEIEDEASAGYVRPEAVVVTLVDGMTLDVEFYNALQVIIPNTDAVNEAEDEADINEEKDNGYFFLIIWLGGSVFILVVGYFYVLKPKLAKKKANKKTVK